MRSREVGFVPNQDEISQIARDILEGRIVSINFSTLPAEADTPSKPPEMHEYHLKVDEVVVGERTYAIRGLLRLTDQDLGLCTLMVDLNREPPTAIVIDEIED